MQANARFRFFILTVKKSVQFIIHGGPVVVQVHVVVRQDIFRVNATPGPRGAKHQVVARGGSGSRKAGVMHRVVVSLLGFG